MKPCEYNYLIFRRGIIFLDEWLSYLLLIYLYYFQNEQNPLILTIVILLMIIFNINGYYHLGLLEHKFGIY